MLQPPTGVFPAPDKLSGTDRLIYMVDLNLLKVLHVLLQERNVSRTAARLFVTQSAVSKSLHKLRDAFNDPLFLRSAHDGLVPTPRAEAMAVRLQDIFKQIEHCVTSSEFVPAIACGPLRIVVPEQFALGGLSKLLLRLRASAPLLHLQSLDLVDNYVDLLAQGAIEFAINLKQEHPAGILRQPLFSGQLMLWCRKGHPLADIAQWSLAAICAQQAVIFNTRCVTADRVRTIDSELGAMGINYNIVLATSHLSVAVDVIASTDAIMLAPDYLCRFAEFGSRIVSRAISHIPALASLSVDLELLQHERTSRSEQHQWIASEIRKAYSEVDS